MTTNNVEELLVKNEKIRDLFTSKKFKKKGLKDYLDYKGYLPKRGIAFILGATTGLPLISNKLFELFPNSTSLLTWIFGFLSLVLALFNATMISTYIEKDYKNDTGKKLQSDDEDALGFCFIFSLLFYGGGNIAFLNYGLNNFAITGFALSSLIPIYYIASYLKDNLRYFKKENDVPYDRDLSIEHEDNVILSKILSKEEMSIFLDVYKKYEDIPYDKIESFKNKNNLINNKKEYLESLYSENKE